MRFPLVCQGLLRAQEFLSATTQVTNSTILTSENTISWNGRTPGILKGMYYPFEYQHLLDRHQYSTLLSDGSFFQFYYRFDSAGDLLKGRLAYYPKPLSTTDDQEDLSIGAENALERMDEDLFDHLYNWVEVMEIHGKNPSNTSHVRFDFDRSVTSHCQSHIQLSGIQELRIPASIFPLPLAFVQLCANLLPGVGSIESNTLGLEKNHYLALTRPPELICLNGASLT